jgi:hypothetical protein
VAAAVKRAVVAVRRRRIRRAKARHERAIFTTCRRGEDATVWDVRDTQGSSMITYEQKDEMIQELNRKIPFSGE